MGLIKGWIYKIGAGLLVILSMAAWYFKNKAAGYKEDAKRAERNTAVQEQIREKEKELRNKTQKAREKRELDRKNRREKQEKGELRDEFGNPRLNDRLDKEDKK